jgi:hypothetical protein
LRKECRLRVFENKALRRIFGPKRDEITGEWRRLHNEELYALYSSPNIIRRGEVHTGLQWGNLREGDHLEDRGVDGRIILKWIFKRLHGAETGLIWLRIGTGGGLLCIR